MGVEEGGADDVGTGERGGVERETSGGVADSGDRVLEGEAQIVAVQTAR